MTWVFLILCAGIVGLAVEIWVVYKRQVQALRSEMETVHQQITRHIQAVQQIRQAMEETQERMAALEVEKADTQAQVNIARQQLAETEERMKRLHPTRLLFELEEEER